MKFTLYIVVGMPLLLLFILGCVKISKEIIRSLKDQLSWLARIRVNGKLKFLGRRKNKQEAIQLYQNALKEIEN